MLWPDRSFLFLEAALLDIYTIEKNSSPRSSLSYKNLGKFHRENHCLLKALFGLVQPCHILPFYIRLFLYYGIRELTLKSCLLTTLVLRFLWRLRLTLVVIILRLLGLLRLLGSLRLLRLRFWFIPIFFSLDNISHIDEFFLEFR